MPPASKFPRAASSSSTNSQVKVHHSEEICLTCTRPPLPIDKEYASYQYVNRATKTIFKYLLIPEKNLKKLAKLRWISYCRKCMKHVEEIAEFQKQVEILELQIQSRVEKLGRRVIKNSSSVSQRDLVIWNSFKQPVVQNYLLGELPNPAVRLTIDPNLDDDFDEEGGAEEVPGSSRSKDKPRRTGTGLRKALRKLPSCEDPCEDYLAKQHQQSEPLIVLKIEPLDPNQECTDMDIDQFNDNETLLNMPIVDTRASDEINIVTPNESGSDYSDDDDLDDLFTPVKKPTKPEPPPVPDSAKVKNKGKVSAVRNLENHTTFANIKIVQSPSKRSEIVLATPSKETKGKGKSQPKGRNSQDKIPVVDVTQFFEKGKTTPASKSKSTPVPVVNHYDEDDENFGVEDSDDDLFVEIPRKKVKISTPRKSVGMDKSQNVVQRSKAKTVEKTVQDKSTKKADKIEKRAPSKEDKTKPVKETNNVSSKGSKDDKMTKDGKRSKDDEKSRSSRTSKVSETSKDGKASKDGRISTSKDGKSSTKDSKEDKTPITKTPKDDKTSKYVKDKRDEMDSDSSTDLDDLFVPIIIKRSKRIKLANSKTASPSLNTSSTSKESKTPSTNKDSQTSKITTGENITLCAALKTPTTEEIPTTNKTTSGGRKTLCEILKWRKTGQTNSSKSLPLQDSGNENETLELLDKSNENQTETIEPQQSIPIKTEPQSPRKLPRKSTIVSASPRKLPPSPRKLPRSPKNVTRLSRSPRNLPRLSKSPRKIAATVATGNTNHSRGRPQKNPGNPKSTPRNRKSNSNVKEQSKSFPIIISNEPTEKFQEVVTNVIPTETEPLRTYSRRTRHSEPTEVNQKQNNEVLTSTAVVDDNHTENQSPPPSKLARRRGSSDGRSSVVGQKSGDQDSSKPQEREGLDFFRCPEPLCPYKKEIVPSNQQAVYKTNKTAAFGSLTNHYVHHIKNMAEVCEVGHPNFYPCKDSDCLFRSVIYVKFSDYHQKLALKRLARHFILCHTNIDMDMEKLPSDPSKPDGQNKINEGSSEQMEVAEPLPSISIVESSKLMSPSYEVNEFHPLIVQTFCTTNGPVISEDPDSEQSDYEAKSRELFMSRKRKKNINNNDNDTVEIVEVMEVVEVVDVAAENALVPVQNALDIIQLDETSEPSNFETSVSLLESFRCPTCHMPWPAEYEDLLEHNWSHLNTLEKNQAVENGIDIPKDLRQSLIENGRNFRTFSFSEKLVAEIINQQMSLEMGKFFENGRNTKMINCKHCSYVEVVGQGGNEGKNLAKRNIIIHFLRDHFKRTHVCEICGQGFSEEHYLERHVGDTHQGNHLC